MSHNRWASEGVPDTVYASETSMDELDYSMSELGHRYCGWLQIDAHTRVRVYRVQVSHTAFGWKRAE